MPNSLNLGISLGTVFTFSTFVIGMIAFIIEKSETLHSKEYIFNIIYIGITLSILLVIGWIGNT